MAWRLHLALLASFGVACSSAPTPPPAPPPLPPLAPKTIAEGAASPVTPTEAGFVVPENLPQSTVPRRKIASGLQNPRGMLELAERTLLVSEAGTGNPANPNTGALSRLEDKNADGDYDDPGERARILDKMHSANVIDVVRRDEVFGMAAIARGDGVVLAAHSMFGAPTTIFRVDGNKATKWSFVHGNLNALTHDPKRNAWFAVSSSSDEVVRVEEDGGSKRIVKFPPLARGQDAVPGYLRFDPATGDILVSLFSGSPEGEEGGSGVELVKRAGEIVRLDPDTGKIRRAVSGLTAPTDFVLDRAGRIYVLELCDGFLDPIPNRAALERVGHGGFRRFSGRLLRVDPKRDAAVVLAEGLDTPTNLALAGNKLYIAEGMGTPAREIPGPTGTVKLDGFIEQLVIGD